MPRFGQVIRDQMVRKKLTLQQLAKASGTYKGYICGMCTGSVNPPSPKMVQRLCTVLDLDYQEMLALAVFEKLPKGLRYYMLEQLLANANREGVTEAPGGVKKNWQGSQEGKRAEERGKKRGRAGS